MLTTWNQSPNLNGSLRALIGCTVIGGLSICLNSKRWPRSFPTTNGCARCCRRQRPALGWGRSSRLSASDRVDDARGSSDTAAMATGPLRNLAVSVVESSPGTFHWKLTEDLVVDLDASMDDFSSWTAAMDAGVEAMRRCADDPSVGPRASGRPSSEWH